MLSAGMTMNVAATNIGCFTHAIRQAKGQTKDCPCEVRASRRVAKTAIFGTPTCAIASKLPKLLPLTHMVHITTVYLPKLCVIACTRVDNVHVVQMLVVCWRDVTEPIVLIGHVHTNSDLDINEIAFFSLTSRGLPFMKVMAGFEYTVGAINVMQTVAYLKEIVLGVGVLSWSGRVLHMALSMGI